MSLNGKIARIASRVAKRLDGKRGNVTGERVSGDGTGALVQGAPRRGNCYGGPFACSLAFSTTGLGGPDNISVSPGYVYAGHACKACDWTGASAWGSGGVDVNNDALAAGDYFLAVLTDVDPDTGLFDDADSTANTYGPILAAIPKTATDPDYAVTDAQKSKYHTDAYSDGHRELDPADHNVACSVTLLASFTIRSDGSFTNLVQLWQGADIYVPVYGWSFTSTGSPYGTNPQAWHPYFNNTPTAETIQWWECGWQINYGALQHSLQRWNAAHKHYVIDQYTESAGSGGGTVPAHVHEIGDSGLGGTTVTSDTPYWPT